MSDSQAEALVEVALFPIPGMVAFPGTVVPLHVFEPRYRRLVHECTEAKRWVAVSNTRKAIHQPTAKEGLTEQLNSNQTTYQSYEVFSAGPVSIIETLPDGRLIAEIDMQERLQLINEQQALPYRIVACQRLTDEDPADAYDASVALRDQVNARLTEILGSENEEAKAILAGPEWAGLAPAEYSFKIFQFLRLDPPIMQTILEQPSVYERLRLLAQALGADID